MKKSLIKFNYKFKIAILSEYEVNLVILFPFKTFSFSEDQIKYLFSYILYNCNLEFLKIYNINVNLKNKSKNRVKIKRRFAIK